MSVLADGVTEWSCWGNTLLTSTPEWRLLLQRGCIYGHLYLHASNIISLILKTDTEQPFLFVPCCRDLYSLLVGSIRSSCMHRKETELWGACRRPWWRQGQHNSEKVFREISKYNLEAGDDLTCKMCFKRCLLSEHTPLLPLTTQFSITSSGKINRIPRRITWLIS